MSKQPYHEPMPRSFLMHENARTLPMHTFTLQHSQQVVLCCLPSSQLVTTRSHCNPSSTWHTHTREYTLMTHRSTALSVRASKREREERNYITTPPFPPTCTRAFQTRVRLETTHPPMHTHTHTHKHAHSERPLLDSSINEYMACPLKTALTTAPKNILNRL